MTAGSLKVSESRVIADLLLQDLTPQQWQTAILEENVLQARSIATAKRLSGLLKPRLETMTAPLWKLIKDGNQLTATHACLAAAVKYSNLLADFFELVLKEQFKLFAPALTNTLWDEFVIECQNRDADLPEWSQQTIKRLKSSVFQILAQAGYVEDTKSLKLQNVHVAYEVVDYLEANNEQRVLRCITVAA